MHNNQQLLHGHFYTLLLELFYKLIIYYFYYFYFYPYSQVYHLYLNYFKASIILLFLNLLFLNNLFRQILSFQALCLCEVFRFNVNILDQLLLMLRRILFFIFIFILLFIEFTCLLLCKSTLFTYMVP
jgi:hypothetical protein